VPEAVPLGVGVWLLVTDRDAELEGEAPVLSDELAVGEVDGVSLPLGVPDGVCMNDNEGATTQHVMQRVARKLLACPATPECEADGMSMRRHPRAAAAAAP